MGDVEVFSWCGWEWNGKGEEDIDAKLGNIPVDEEEACKIRSMSHRELACGSKVGQDEFVWVVKGKTNSLKM